MAQPVMKRRNQLQGNSFKGKIRTN